MGQRKGFSQNDLAKINARYCSNQNITPERPPQGPDSRYPNYPDYGNNRPIFGGNSNGPNFGGNPNGPNFGGNPNGPNFGGQRPPPNYPDYGQSFPDYGPPRPQGFYSG